MSHLLDASRAGPEQPFPAEAQGHEDRQEQGEADGVAAPQHVGQHAAGIGDLARQTGYRLGQGAEAVPQVLETVAESARHGVGRIGSRLGGRTGATLRQIRFDVRVLDEIEQKAQLVGRRRGRCRGIRTFRRRRGLGPAASEAEHEHEADQTDEGAAHDGFRGHAAQPTRQSDASHVS